MDKSVPKGAAKLLDFIGSKEAPRGYGTVYGNKQSELATPLTSMTVGQIVNAKPSFTKRFKSSACGRYQFMNATLKSLVAEGACELGDVFTPNLQDRLGYHLLRRRGYAAFISGRIGRTEFGKRLAQEWASFPVLAAGQGAHRSVARGETYYAGDGINKVLIKPEQVEAVLDQVKSLGGAVPAAPKSVPMPVPRPENIVAPTIDEAEADDDGAPELEEVIATDPSPALARKVQQRLKDLGYHEVGIVGTGWGPRSKDTLNAWKASWNRRHPEAPVELGDALTDDVVAKLDRDEPRQVSEARANATEADLPEDKKKVVSWGQRIRNWFVGLGIVGFGGEQTGLIDQAESWSYGWLRIRGVMESIGITLADNWPFVLIAGGVGVWLVVQHIKNKDLALVREGKLMS